METKKTVTFPECTKIILNKEGLSGSLKYVHGASLNAVQPMPSVQPTTLTTENDASKFDEGCPLLSSNHQNVFGKIVDVNTTP